MPLIPIIAGAAVVGIATALIMRANKLRVFIITLPNSTFSFHVKRGEKIVFTSPTPFGSVSAAMTAANAWIAANPDAGK
jgi:hypothetical protein